ncbi:hypothetical protein, partial [Stenotrophomonas maltophilia]|uniref:hypothetical protein n=1 Tax=Stenotrophomonas maltophilia TaxID=40324 RepID=UPI001953F485
MLRLIDARLHLQPDLGFLVGVRKDRSDLGRQVLKDRRDPRSGLNERRLHLRSFDQLAPFSLGPRLD